MAVRLLAYQVADLCLGKPPLRCLSAANATVGDAISALKSADTTHVGVWTCDHSKNPGEGECLCVGRVCMADIICYLSKIENLSSPATALKSPVSVLLSKVPNLVRHVEPSSSLLEAIELILEGTGDLVVPIKNQNPRRKNLELTSHRGHEFCWLTQEDVIRFLLSSIGLFSPIPALSISSLSLITTNFSSMPYQLPASSAIAAVSRQLPVAIIDSDGSLVGEISPFTLSCCNETTAAAVATLSAGDLMAYIDCGSPPDDLVRAVESRLRECNLEKFFEKFVIADDISVSCSSSEDEDLSWTELAKVGRYRRSSSHSARMGRRAEAIVCNRESSLVAVMTQAISHRVNYVWVIEEEDCSVVGIVTFSSMLEVFYEHLDAIARGD